MLGLARRSTGRSKPSGFRGGLGEIDKASFGGPPAPYFAPFSPGLPCVRGQMEPIWGFREGSDVAISIFGAHRPHDQ